MKFSQIITATILCFLLQSCQNGVDKKRDVEREKNEVPSTERQNTEKSLPQLNRQKPVEKQLERELKKKKQRALDTLKPIKVQP